MSHRNTSVAIKHALNLSMPNSRHDLSLYVSTRSKSLYINKFILDMLQVNVNRCNYKFYVDIYIQRSLSIIYICIRLARINITYLSYLHTRLQHSSRWIYIFRRLKWIDINVVNLITMHILIMLRNSCLSISCYTILLQLHNFITGINNFDILTHF